MDSEVWIRTVTLHGRFLRGGGHDSLWDLLILFDAMTSIYERHVCLRRALWRGHRQPFGEPTACPAWPGGNGFVRAAPKA